MIGTANSLKAEQAAIKTLVNLNYTYHGAELWKPPVIDTRTDTEKAIDSLKEIFGYDQVGYVDLVTEIKSGNIHGVKWVGNDETN